MNSQTTRAAALTFAGLSLMGALAACAPGSATTTDPGTTGTDAGSGSSDTSAAYTDGSYTADGEYQAPSGKESITVEVTLAGDKITEVTVTPHATDPTAKGHQNEFVSGISAEVVGKDIDTLSVSRVSGSSLTSGGFNAAIEDIKAQALES